MRPLIVFLFILCVGFMPIGCQNAPTRNVATPASTAKMETPKNAPTSPMKMRGLSFVAPPKPFKAAPMQAVKAVNADWIAVIPYGFTRLNEATVHYKTVGAHWWGESPTGVSVSIDSAHQAGINVLLKPQVYVPGGWTGGLDFEKPEDWARWETAYTQYIMLFAQMAQEKKVAGLCVGTEFKIGVVKREAYWRDLIKKIRAVYSGKLFYAANWDEYALVPFWDALDCIGVNAYFPLLPGDTPSVSDLKKSWQPIFEQLKAFSEKNKKPIAFTEFGYLSVDGCAYNSWEVEKRVRSLKINELAQANAFDALFDTFWSADWWCGGFLWKWFPEGQGHEGYPERDYTPQGKMSEKILRGWYAKP